MTLLNLFVIFLDLMVKVLDFSAKGFGFIRSHGLREFVRKIETGKSVSKDNPPSDGSGPMMIYEGELLNCGQRCSMRSSLLANQKIHLLKFVKNREIFRQSEMFQMFWQTWTHSRQPGNFASNLDIISQR